MTPQVLLVGGSLNQTTMMTAIARELRDCDCFFAPFFADGLLRHAARAGLLDFTILAGQARRRSLEHVRAHGMPVDERGARGTYDVVVLGTDLVVPKAVRGRRLVLVQEGMTDP